MIEIGHVFSGKISSRKQLGLPDNWNLVEEWLDATSDNSAENESNLENFTPKWPNIPVLRDYSVDPGDEFWKHFPSRPMPMKPESSIDAYKLEEMVQERKHKMTFTTDPRHSIVTHRHIFATGTNICTSFEPNKMTCTHCGGGEHPVLLRGGSTGGCGQAPKCFVLSDQCFPPVLPADGDGDCLAIIKSKMGICPGWLRPSWIW
jgi:hypothetical protein